MPKYRLSFWFLLLLVAAVPLAISTYFQNPDDLVKSVTLKIVGGLFIVVTLAATFTDASWRSRFRRNPGWDKVSGSRRRVYAFPEGSAIDLAVLFFLAAATLSTVLSIDPLVSLFGQYQRQVGLISFLYVVGVYFLSPFALENEERVRTIFRVMEGAAVLLSIYAVLQVLGSDPFALQPARGAKRPVATFGNPIFVGGFLVSVFPFSLLNISQKKNIFLRTLFPIIILGGIVVSQTRSAYLALAAEAILLAIIYLRLSRKRRVWDERKDRAVRVGMKRILMLLVWATASAAAISIVFPHNEFTRRVVSILGAENNPRWLLWRDSFQVFKKYPIFGPGIAMFPTAFEEFYSHELRWAEAGKYFDHPHNNFMFMLCSMGILGLLAYAAIIVQGMRMAIRNFFDREKERRRLAFAAFCAFFIGYAVYGITNFDDITMILYLFVILAALRVLIAKNGSTGESMRVSRTFVFFRRVLAGVIILLVFFNMYDSINELRADRHFKSANLFFAGNNFKESVSNMNRAIELNNYCAAYKFALAYNIYKFCAANETLPRDAKLNLLNQASGEVKKAKQRHYFRNECDALMSLVYYEMGRQEEAERLKANLLDRDSINVNYRLQLARYYIKAGRWSDAQEQVNVALKVQTKNVETFLTAALLSLKLKKRDEAILYCEKVLELDPDNQIARRILSEMTSVQSEDF